VVLTANEKQKNIMWGEPFRLGFAQDRLQAEASTLELSVPVIPIPRLPPAIGCREKVGGGGLVT